MRRQMEEQRSALSSALQTVSTPGRALADAYGAMGTLLQAATHFDAAEASYLNAQALAPTDGRWPYFLAHIYRVQGPLDKAAASFERALQLESGNVAALVWLGEVHLADGRPDAAEPLFAKALAQPSSSAAARYGLGRAALARKDFARAAKELSAAFALDPAATATHYPLAMAYRGLGDARNARAHLALQGDIEPRPDDPLMRELDERLESPESYNVRGGRALGARNWAVAAAAFRKGLELAPGDTSLRHRLGTVLAQMGDVQGAVEQFEHVLRVAPTHARAHFSLGVLMADGGRYSEAVERLLSAVQHEPGYVQAQVQLARALARSGRAAEALPHYAKALDMDPTDAEAAFGQAMALVRLRRYSEARDRLAEASKTYANQPMFSHALARLLAAAPDDRVRDGTHAKAIVDDLFKRQQSFEVGETIAMVLAELGAFGQAAEMQRTVMAAAERAQLPAVVERMSANLRLYEGGQPCRTPFTEGEFP